MPDLPCPVPSRLVALAILAAGLGASGCASTSTPAPDTARAEVADASQLPTPFTAAQIRDNTYAGKRLVYRTTRPNVPVTYREVVFTAANAETATMRNCQVDANGVQAGDSVEIEAAWTELRDHARFPEGATRQRAQCHCDLGTFDGWRYTVPGPNDSVMTYYFADDKPGPPVHYEQTRDGNLVSKSVLIEEGKADGA